MSADALTISLDGRDDRERLTFDGVVGNFRHAEDRAFPRVTYNHSPGVPNGRTLTVFLAEIRMIDWESAGR